MFSIAIDPSEAAAMEPVRRAAPPTPEAVDEGVLARFAETVALLACWVIGALLMEFFIFMAARMARSGSAAMERPHKLLAQRRISPNQSATTSCAARSRP